MEKQDLKHILDEYLERIRQSGKKETSDLVGGVKLSHGEIKSSLDEIKRRLDTANGYTAKHEQRLNSLDVINAQTTLSQQQTATTLEKVVKTLETLSEAKNKAEGSLSAFKWLIATLGVGNIVLIVQLFV